MRSISEVALGAAKERWNALLVEKGSGEVEFAHEIFAVASALRSSVVVSRSLTDPARNADDRTKLASDIFSGKISGEVLDLFKGLVREHWAADEDLLTALEEIGVDSILASAQRSGTLTDVEEELYRAMRTLRDERGLRNALVDRNRSVDDREALVRQVFAKTKPETLELLARAVQRVDDATLAQSLSHYGNLAAERDKHLVATVTAAIPMSKKQEERLASILKERYGKEVALHIALDPAIVGGLRIHIGDDVIDGTLATRIARVRNEISK
ncbi:MAG: F0F1 ATP synthase subunit delta [Actinomycetaceae bacterium]|nr:F0F1 ATP synthase subunit delta [Actinomycetaceae bacterium]